MIDLAELSGFAKRIAAQMSRGQQQRVTLASRPSVLLLDEPVGAPDFKPRRQVHADLTQH